MNPGTPLSAILHCYDRAQSGAEEFDPEKFQPDGRTMRSNAFMAIAKGSSCLSWWWWGQGGTTTATIARAPRAWADLKLVFADIQSLEPALIADGTVEMWVESPGEGKEVHVWEKRLADRALIIAVNRDPEPCELTITLKQTAGTKTARRLLEEGAAQIVDGKLQESFGPLGVHVYEVR